MSESGLLNLGDSFHLECLWFCFAKVIQADLDKVKDHWNSHSMHSRHDTVSGVPDVFFFLPEYSGATDCLVPLTQAQVDEIDQYCELKRQFLGAVLKPTARMFVAPVMKLRTLPRVKSKSFFSPT